MEANVKLDARLLRDAHDVISHLEEEILDRGPDIDRLLIHFEPEEKESIFIATPPDIAREAQPELDSLLSEHFGEAPRFALVRKEVRSGEIFLEPFVENRFRNLKRHRGVKVAELLAGLGVDEVWTRAALDGKGAGYALEALGIDVLTMEATTLRELLSEFAEDSDELEVKSQKSHP